MRLRYTNQLVTTRPTPSRTPPIRGSLLTASTRPAAAQMATNEDNPMAITAGFSSVAFHLACNNKKYESTGHLAPADCLQMRAEQQVSLEALHYLWRPGLCLSLLRFGARQLLSAQASVTLQKKMIESQTGTHLEVLDELLRSLLHLIGVRASACAFEAAAAAASAILRLVRLCHHKSCMHKQYFSSHPCKHPLIYIM